MNTQETVLAAFSNLNAPDALVLEVKRLPPPELQSWVQVIDESPYPLSEWAEALIAFHAWQQQNRRTLSLTHQIEYLACCVQGTQNDGKLMTLKAVWENYVENYGVA